MPARLVYAPKVWCFIKNSSGDVGNYSDYVTAGEVNRLVNQASTATVTLRNPNKKFTIPSQGVTFHPMDPISIFLQRLDQHPVQVFTGYLDQTPYYQMYPGTVTLKATCTLKRLLYTYFDPSLPYVFSFFKQFGWVDDGQGSLTNLTALGNPATVGQGKTKTLQDGSIAKLLYATLRDIGQWDDTNIWIEALPSGANGIAARMAKLMATLITEEDQAATEFTAFMHEIIGSAPQGGGGGPAGGTGANTSTPSTPGTPPGGYTPITWAAALLQALGDGVTDANMQAIVGWETAEGGNWHNAARFNPLNTTQGAAGSTNPGFSAGVQAYTSWAEGLQATVQTLNNGSYNGILTALKAGNNAQAVAAAIGASPWGTSASGASSAIAAAPSNLGGTSVPSPSTSSSSPTITSGSQLLNQPHHKLRTRLGASAQQTQSATGATTTSVFTPHGGNAGFFPAPGTDYTQGDEPTIAARLDQLGRALGIHITGLSGYRTPQHSVAVGGFADDPHTRGDASDSPGVEGVPESTLNRYGLTRPFGGAAEADHIQLLGVPLGPIINSPGPGTAQPGGVTPPSGTSSTGAGASAAGAVMTSSSAEAFTATINFPSIMDTTAAILLGQEGKGLMHDQNLLPFIQQLTEASMRSFQSLPNGDFYAFYPDYFGEFNAHPPYWEIDDIEILEGNVYLNDNSLVTHEYAVGDNTYPQTDNQLYNELFSAGTITIFNAFLDPALLTKSGAVPNADLGMAGVMSKDEATRFIERYGARPQVQDYPMVRSPMFEMFLAYQQFLLAWSNQFKTPFTFTFMPELFPGGKVAFPGHGIQMYVDSVTHTWDFGQDGGFTTTAELSAPAAMSGTPNPDIPPQMVRALVEPTQTPPTTSKPNNKKSSPSSFASGKQKGLDTHH